MPDMVTEEKKTLFTGSNSAQSIADEQSLITDANNPIATPRQNNFQTIWFPSWNASDYPASAYIDLGTGYSINKIYFSDASPQDNSFNSNVKIEYGSPGNWQVLDNVIMADWTGWTSNTNISNYNVTTRYVRFTMQSNAANFKEISIYANTNGNQIPTADAGSDQVLNIPYSNFTLTGKGFDTDGTITAYNWTKVSGPGDAITSASAFLTLNNLPAGNYTFRLMVTDNNGAIGMNDVKVTVNHPPSTGVMKIPLQVGINGIIVQSEEPFTGNWNQTINDIIDEQAGLDPLNGVLSNGSSPQTVWNPSPITPTNQKHGWIDLGKPYQLSYIYLKAVQTPSFFSEDGENAVKVEYGTPDANGNPTNWQPLGILNMVNAGWQNLNVLITTRFLRFTLESGGSPFSEVVLYGNDVMQQACGTSNPIQWTNAANSIIGNDGSLSLTSSLTGTANSVNALEPGNDGWLEWTVGPVNNSYTIGFSGVKTLDNSAYSLKLTNGTMGLMSGGVLVFNFGSVVATDKFRLERVGTKIRVTKNQGLPSETVNTIETIGMINVFFSASDSRLYSISELYAGILPVVSASFCEPLKIDLQPVNAHYSDNTMTGSLGINVSGGSGNYNYNWYQRDPISGQWKTDAGYNGPVRSGLMYGESRKILVTDAITGASKSTVYSLTSNVYWKSFQNLSLNPDNSLTINPGGTLPTSNSISKNTLDKGQEGWIEWTVGLGNAKDYAVGFTNPQSNLSPFYHPDNLPEIGIYYDNQGYMSFILGGEFIYYNTLFGINDIIEDATTARFNGQLVGITYVPIRLPVVPEDVIKISREGGSVKFFINGVPIAITVTLTQESGPDIIVTKNIEFSNGIYPNRFFISGSSVGKIPPIRTSFQEPFIINANKGVGFSNKIIGDHLEVEATGGKKPYKYEWLSSVYPVAPNLPNSVNISSAGQSITGIYGVKVTDALNNVKTSYFAAGYPISWSNEPGKSPSANTLFSSDGTYALNNSMGGRYATAISANVIPGGQEGWVEVQPGKITNNARYYNIGLSLEPDALTTSQKIDFSFNLYELQFANGLTTVNFYNLNGLITINNNCFYGSGLYYLPGCGGPSIMAEDVVRIAKEKDVNGNFFIRYYINGVKITESALDAATANTNMRVMSLLSQGDRIPVIATSHLYLGSNNTPLTSPPVPTDDMNYVVENTILIPGITDITPTTRFLAEEMRQKVSYFDGLGRPIQTVITSGSPAKNDIIQPVVYDQFGRISINYSPYTSNQLGLGDGKYRNFNPDPTVYKSSEQYLFYRSQSKVATNPFPYATTVYEASSLSRVLEQGAVGAAWQPLNASITNSGHSIKTIRGTNLENEVRLWTYDAINKTATSFNDNTGFYVGSSAVQPAGQLNMNETSDEHGLKIRVFTDINGKVVCKKVQKVLNDETSFISTYQIYDNFGNLRFVLPPEAVNNLSDPEVLSGNVLTINYTSNFTNNRVFSYDYDQWQRLIIKHVPGAGISFMVYDNADRLVLSQDENLRANHNWKLIKYDAFSRPILNGLYTNTNAAVIDQATMQVAFNSGNATVALFEIRQAGTAFGYSNTVFPNTNLEILSATYYDDYDYDYSGTPDVAYVNPANINPTLNTFEPSNFRAIGQITGSKVKVLDSSPVKYLLSSPFYDAYGRHIQNQADNHVGGRDTTCMRYDFAGKLLETLLLHNPYGLGRKVALQSRSTYDHAGRILKAEFAVNNTNTWKPLATYAYNELGQLTEKHLGNELQKVDFAYHLRGWLSKINDAQLSEAGDIFGMELKYEDTPLYNNAQYNGNISKISWENLTDEIFRNYDYQYDGLNRLKGSTYSSGKPYENFNLGALSYDDNGNILTLQRSNLVSRGDNTNPKYDLVDDLYYNYKKGGAGASSNQLYAVDDRSNYKLATDALADDFSKKVSYTGSDEYTFDNNGNLLSDANKGITSILYNHLNLPKQIVYANGDNIINIYDASGVKLEKQVSQAQNSPTTTQYLSGIIYEQSQLQFVPTVEGRLLTKDMGGIFIDEYFIKDHLGSLRAAFRAGNINNSKATMETVSNCDPLVLDHETQIWNNITNTRDAGQHYPDLCGGAKSAKLNSSQPLGPWRMIKVGKGDAITFSVKAHYVAGNKFNVSLSALASLINISMNNPAKQENNFAKLQAGLSFTPIWYGNPSTPKAYIQYIIFDKDYNYVGMGYKAISSAAATNPFSWEDVSLSYQVMQDGYIQVLTANESDLPVWFDEINLDQKESLVVQENHYDLWGVALTGIEKTGNPDHKYKFNLQEHIEDLDLGWYTYKYREYDPTYCRFTRIDPITENYYELTSYQFASNNPSSKIEIEGLEGAYIWQASGVNPNASSSEMQNYLEMAKNAAVTQLTEIGKAGLILASFFPFTGPELSIIRYAATAERSIIAVEAKTLLLEEAAISSNVVLKEESLAERATVIQNAQTTQKGRNLSTTSVAEVESADGTTYRAVSSSRKALTKEQRAALREGEVEIKGEGHAETTIVDHVNKNKEKIIDIAASRPVCNNCAQTLYNNGVNQPLSPLKNSNSNPWLLPTP